MKREEIREEINSRPLTEFYPLQVSKGKNKYVCPLCKSGTGAHGTGALTLFNDDNRVMCFACGGFGDKGQDTLGALRILWNCSENEVFERVGFNLSDMSEVFNNSKRSETKQIIKSDLVDYTDFYNQCHNELRTNKEAQEYLLRRGITSDTIKRFNIGFDTRYKSIIVPRSNYTYLYRSINSSSKGMNKGGSSKHLFNLQALTDNPEYVFICEGEFDAMSLMQAGAICAVGTISTNYINNMFEESKKHPNCIYILCLDNDDAGNKAQSKLYDLMKGAGLFVYAIDENKKDNFFVGCKDANEAYTKNSDLLTANIVQEVELAKKYYASIIEETAESLKERTGAEMFKSFLQAIETDKYRPFSTGIKQIDTMLYGGFTRGTLVMLGASAGMGKTCLCQWLFETMAMNGHDVVYLNLEMARDQLLARSISRLCYEYLNKNYSALKIMRGYEWTELQFNHIAQASKIYIEKIAPHIVYNPCAFTPNRNSILQVIESEIARIEGQGKDAPMICLDYLQLVQPEDKEDETQGIKQTILELKRIAEKHNTVVFCIMANNRTSNKSGVVEMESGRDTSTIEYSADLMLGLVYSYIEDNKYRELEDGKKQPYTLDMIKQEKRVALDNGLPIPPSCNHVTLKVIKDRFGSSERRVHMIFDGEHSHFKFI